MISLENRGLGPNPDSEDATNFFTTEQLDYLEDQGYKVVRRIGAGHTRDAFLVERTRAGLEQRLVMKKPKTLSETTSVQARVANSKKRNWDSSEVRIAPSLNHPNVASIIDCLSINGENWNVERYFGGNNLRENLELAGVPTEEKFFDIMEGLLSGVEYLHSRDIVHRDLKPENIMVTPEGVIITDLQTAKNHRHIEPSFLPTRGSERYTHPSLLNSFIQQTPSKSSFEEDLFGVGVIAYELLTREKPFEYNIVEDERGKPIRVGDSDLRVSIRRNGTDIEKISEAEFLSDINQAITRLKKRGVTKSKRNFVKKLLSSRDVPYSGSELFLKELKMIRAKSKSKLRSFIREDLPDVIKIGGGVGIAGAIIGGGLLSAYIATTHSFKDVNSIPPQPGILQRVDAREGFPFEVNEEINRIIVPRLLYAKERLENLENNDLRILDDWGEIQHSSRRAEDIHLIESRLISSILRSILLTGNPEIHYEIQRGEGYNSTLVPERFIRENMDIVGDLTRISPISATSSFLKSQISHQQDLPDLFATYFATPAQIEKAKSKIRRDFNLDDWGQTISYFPAIENGETMHPGYRAVLPKLERNLIDTAVGLYKISSFSGVKWNRLNVLEKSLEN